jgi:hypothetical protein
VTLFARGTGGVAALALIAVADTGTAAPDAAAPTPSPQGAGGLACLETATEGQLDVELCEGDIGFWRKDLSLKIHKGIGELSGVFDDLDSVAKQTSKRRDAPRLRLKGKALNAGQRAELLKGLRVAIDRPEERHRCWSSGSQTAKLTWTCAGPGAKSGSLSFDGDQCVSWEKGDGYTKAFGVTDWAVAELRRHGARPDR